MSPAEAVARLLNRDVVALPTETVYGLAAIISSDEALHKIFKTKSRPFFDPLIVHVENTAQARTLTSEWSALHEFLATHLWPGPLTLIAPKNPKVSSLITSGLETVALRCPSHPVFQEVLKGVGSPLAAPSANRFGKTSPTQASHVTGEFNGQVPVVDGGPSKIGLESTVAFPHKNEEGRYILEILRPGFISQEKLKTLLQKFPHPVQIQVAQKINSPGHLENHYQPDKPLYIYTTPNLTLKNSAELLLNDDPVIAARNLYDELRKLSGSSHDSIHVLKKPTQTGELWTAIWDRLEKASTK